MKTWTAFLANRGAVALAIVAGFTVPPITAFAAPPGAQPATTPAITPPAPATATDAKPAEANTPPANALSAAPAATETVTSSEAGSSLVASQPEQGAVPLDELDLGQPIEESGKKGPFLSDSTLKLGLRSYYFYRDKYDDTISEAEALGASLAFKSGYLFKHLAVGAVLYTSQPIYAPSDHDGTGLLKEDQDGYTVLGQIYGEVKITDGLQMNFGRKEYNTPYINMHDVRMTPKTFQGVTFTGTHKGHKEGSNWRYGAGYLYKMKDWTNTTFHWTSEALGVTDEDRGIFMAGGNYSTDKLSFGAIDYFSPDMINIFYSEGSYGWKFGSNMSLKLGAQVSNQSSTGSNLVTGEDFDALQWGVKADFGISSATITLGYTDVTGGDTNMRGPWGGYPGYTSVQVKDFNRADESAIMLKAAYDFTKLGATGLSAYALWCHGLSADVDDTVFNEDEYDLNLQWSPKDGKMKDFSARVRYARINQRGGDDPSIDDFRLILNYSFNIK